MEDIVSVYSKFESEILEYIVLRLSVENSLQVNEAELMEHVHTEFMKVKGLSRVQVEELFQQILSGRATDFLAEYGIDVYPDLSGFGQMFIAEIIQMLTVATELAENNLIDVVSNLIQSKKQLETGNLSEKVVSEIGELLKADKLKETITEDGFVGLVDASGKKWSLQRYVEAVIRTKLTEADIEADKAMGLAEGIDLAYISNHGATDDCSKWEWVLVSMNGLTAGLPTVEQIKQTKECFHINCGHHLNPVRSLELVPADVIAKTQKQLGINLHELLNSEVGK